MALERKEIEQKYKWDLSQIYSTEADFDADLAEAKKLISAFGKHEATMTKSAADLYAALSDNSAIADKIQLLWCYAHLGFAVDTSDNTAQGRVARVRSLAVEADSATWFLTPRLMELDEAVVEGWYAELPELGSYDRIIGKALAR